MGLLMDLSLSFICQNVICHDDDDDDWCRRLHSGAGYVFLRRSKVVSGRSGNGTTISVWDYYYISTHTHTLWEIFEENFLRSYLKVLYSSQVVHHINNCRLVCKIR